MNPYAHRILSLLEDRDPLAILSETPQRLETLAPALSRRAGQSYAPGKWTALELMCHLADAETSMAFRLRQIVAGVEVIQPWDQDVWAKPYSKLSLTLAMSTFLAVRAWNLAWLEALDRAEWQRSYSHPERGPETFEIALRLLAGHDLNHFRQLEQIAAQPTGK